MASAENMGGIHAGEAQTETQLGSKFVIMDFGHFGHQRIPQNLQCFHIIPGIFSDFIEKLSPKSRKNPEIFQIF